MFFFVYRSKSIEKEKKGRGRPRKNQIQPAIIPVNALVRATTPNNNQHHNVPQQPLAPPKTTPNKKETVKKSRARNTRLSSSYQSRATISTDSFSDDEPSTVKTNSVSTVPVAAMQQLPPPLTTTALPTSVVRPPSISPRNKGLTLIGGLPSTSLNDKTSNYTSSPASRDE